MAFIKVSALTAVLLAVVPFAVANPQSSKDCNSSTFFYLRGNGNGCCAPKTPPRAPAPPPAGRSCPTNGWYWDHGNDCCLPNKPSPPQPVCGNGHSWRPGVNYCAPQPRGPGDCDRDHEFFYGPKSCCLPKVTPPSKPTPPAGKSCPTDPWNWYWHTGKECCVPSKPNPPSTPSCPSGHGWQPALGCCTPHDHPNPPTPPPKPSSKPGYPGQHHYKKRSPLSRSIPDCPRNLEACPISGLTAGNYECLDTTVELESCGGCASTGKGQDCTAIKGAKSVGCETGSCKVYSCQPGYTLSLDGASCVHSA